MVIETHAANCSCCGFDQEIFSPEAHARRNFLKTAALGLGATGLGMAPAAATPAR